MYCYHIEYKINIWYSKVLDILNVCPFMWSKSVSSGFLTPMLPICQQMGCCSCLPCCRHQQLDEGRIRDEDEVVMEYKDILPPDHPDARYV